MNFALGFATVAALALIAARPAGAMTLAFEDNKLNFRSCDGAAVTARWRGMEFSLSEPGKSLGDAHGSFKFTGWDGSCRSASWDRHRATFLIDADGKVTPSDTVRYVAPDGSKWVGMRAGDGFFVSRIATAENDASVARIEEVAAWLARSSKEFTPGAALAESLKAEAGK